MPRCPWCARKFNSQTNILQHMNQPSSSCLTHFEECITIATTLEAISKSDDLGQQNSEPLDFMGTAEDYFPLSLPTSSSQNSEDSTSQNTEVVQNPFIIKKHPTSSQVYRCGETFMDRCDKDEFMERRKSNIYYPFTSRDEWELASFLLCSLT